MGVAKVREDLSTWWAGLGLEQVMLGALIVGALVASLFMTNISCGITIDSRPSVTTTTTVSNR